MKLTSGTIWKQLVRFYLPLLMGSLLQQLYNTADAIVVGKYIGKEALSAVGGATGTLFGLIIGLFTGIASGSTVVVGRFFGADKEKEVADTVQTSLWISIIAGVFIGVVGYQFAPWLLTVMNTPPEIMPEAITYMSIIFYGTVFSLLYNMCSSIMRALGDSKTPMVLGIIGSSVNISMNLIFVLGFKCGVEGVAYATVLSQIVSSIMGLVVLRRNEHIKITNWIKPVVKKEYMGQILKAGLPTGVHTLMYGVSNGIIQANINLFGTDTVAGWTAYSKIGQYYWTIMAAMGITITAFVSQNQGAGKSDRVKSGVRQALFMASGATIVMSIVFRIFSRQFIGIFTEDAVVLETGIEILHFLSGCYIMYAAGEILIGALRGIGQSFAAMVSSFITVCALSVAWVYLVRPFNNVLITLTGFPLTWIVSSVVLIIYWRILIRKKIV